MHAYGVKRNWNECEIMLKNGQAERRTTHTKNKKLGHRKARRVAKHQLKMDASAEAEKETGS